MRHLSLCCGELFFLESTSGGGMGGGPGAAGAAKLRDSAGKLRSPLDTKSESRKILTGARASRKARGPANA